MPRLKKFRVDFISILKSDDPANGKGIVYKSDNGGFRFELQMQLLKKNALKRELYGTVYPPGEADTQDDWALREEITEAAHQFLIEKRTDMVDIDHSYRPDEGTSVVESFIKNGPDDRFADAPEGSWCVVIKLSDTASKDIDEYRGLSMAGGGVRDYTAPRPNTSVTAATRFRHSSTTPGTRFRTKTR